MLDKLITFLASPTGAATALLLIVFVCLVIVFYNASKKGDLDWRDLVTRTNSNKVSLSKILQLLGGITATWVIVKITIAGNGSGLSWEIFTAYLAYVGSVEAYSKHIAFKQNALGRESTPSLPRRRYSDHVDSEETESKEARPGAAKAID